MTSECQDCGELHPEPSPNPCRACGETRPCQLANYECWHLCESCAEGNDLCEECHFPVEPGGRWCEKCGVPAPFEDPNPTEICGGMAPVMQTRARGLRNHDEE